MAFDWLKPKPATRITTAWGTSLVDVLNFLYGWLTDGTKDINIDELFANYGFFNWNVLVQGKPVIKDGDPISLYDIFDYAQSKITAAINLAQVTSLADLIRQYTGYLPSIWTKLSPVRVLTSGDVGIAIYGDFVGVAKDSTLQTTNTKLDSLNSYASQQTAKLDYLQRLNDIYSRFAQVYLDEYGRVGVAIYDDEVGLAKDTTLSAVSSKLDTIQGTLQEALGILKQRDLRCYDATVDTLYAVPEGTVWYARNVYVTDGELYVDGEVKVCG